MRYDSGYCSQATEDDLEEEINIDAESAAGEEVEYNNEAEILKQINQVVFTK